MKVSIATSSNPLHFSRILMNLKFKIQIYDSRKNLEMLEQMSGNGEEICEPNTFTSPPEEAKAFLGNMHSRYN